MQKVRVAVIGTGRIAQRFVEECRAVPEIEVAAIYNQRKGSGVFFAEKLGIDANQVVITDQIDEVDAVVDAVYIATPHGSHSDYIRLFLEKGKHVLCEKPMCLSGEEAIELYTMARERKLVLMEAIKTAYCPGFVGLLSLLEQGVIGQIYDVEACFTKIGAAAGRELWDDCGGSFTELGSYSLLPIVKLLGTKSVESYIWSLDSVTGVDSYTKMVISYEKATATAKTGLGVKSEGELLVAGESGYIRIPSPWWLTRRIEVHHENPNQIEVYDAPFEGSGLRYEIASFCSTIEEMLSEVAEWESVMVQRGVIPDESIWMACQMEMFLQNRTINCSIKDTCENRQPNIWAHRGCSIKYPENTLLAFEKAAQIPGITGIELDVQLTKDGEIVVIHDEKVDRTTNGCGYVKDYTLEEIKKLAITPSGRREIYVEDGSQRSLTIPTLREVLECLLPYFRENGLKLNIELKNSIIPYEGMEQKVIDMVAEYNLPDRVVYSSFNHASVGLVKKLCPTAQTGTLAGDILVCIDGALKYQADALHPCNAGMAINPDTVDMLKEIEIPIRMWNSEEPLFGQSRELKKSDLNKYVALGATDIITNVPENYL